MTEGGHREWKPWARDPLPRGVRVAVWLLRACGAFFKGLAMFAVMFSIPAVCAAMGMSRAPVWWLDVALLGAGVLLAVGSAMQFFAWSIEDAHRRLAHGETDGGELVWPRMFVAKGLGLASDAAGGLGVLLVLYGVVLWIQRENAWVEWIWGICHVAAGALCGWAGKRLERSAP